MLANRSGVMIEIQTEQIPRKPHSPMNGEGHPVSGSGQSGGLHHDEISRADQGGSKNAADASCKSSPLIEQQIAALLSLHHVVGWWVIHQFVVDAQPRRIH